MVIFRLENETPIAMKLFNISFQQSSGLEITSSVICYTITKHAVCKSGSLVSL